METIERTSVAELFDKIKDVKMCMFSTIDSKGKIHSRPMATIQAEEGSNDIYFFTNAYSEKIDEINVKEEVNLSYSDEDHQLYVSVSGSANVVRDKERIKQLWKPFYRVWFPDGIDDPKLALLKVEPSQAEFWDAPSNKMVQLFGIAKAFITGEEYNQGEHKTVVM
jgi:general stress protein 26